MLTRKQFFKKIRRQAPKGRLPSMSTLERQWRAYEAERQASKQSARAASFSPAQQRNEEQQRREREKRERKAAARQAAKAGEAWRLIPLERTIQELDQEFRARSEGL